MIMRLSGLIICFSAIGTATSVEKEFITRVPIYSSPLRRTMKMEERTRRLQEYTLNRTHFSKRRRKSSFFDGVTEVYQGYGAHFIDLWIG